MTSTINVSRSLRVENETGITGAEAQEVEGVQTLSQTISASTEEEVALAAFKDHQLQSMAVICDQASVCEFLGVRYAILQTVQGPPGTITYTGDLEQEIFPGDIVRVEGTVADDGYYLVDAVAEAAGTTTLTLGGGQAFPTGGGGAVGTFARVASQQNITYTYAAATVTAATGVITYTGDISDKFAVGDILRISISTGNDGIWSITAVTTDGPPVTTTSITVEDLNDAGLLPDDTNDGEISLCRTGINLTANIPFLWSIESGITNPFLPHGNEDPGLTKNDMTFNAFRGDVAVCMVTNEAASAAAFQARVATNAIL
jgi:hypothetical protein